MPKPATLCSVCTLRLRVLSYLYHFFNLFPQVLGPRGFFLISFSEQSVCIKIVGFFAVALRQMQRSFLVCRDIDIF